MSVFRTQTLACPACREPVPFQVVYSVNAGRSPELRTAILDGSFQRQTCAHCGQSFRLDPEMTYFDLGRKQWLLVRPAGALGEWPALEEHARQLFAEAFGNNPPAGLRDQLAAIRPRVTFGWSALREKLLCGEHDLDDVTLELVKLAVIRGLDDAPLADDTELRLVAVEGDELVLAWIQAATEQLVETLRVPRALYDSIAADPQSWQALREELSAGPFVDVHRLLVEAA